MDSYFVVTLVIGVVSVVLAIVAILYATQSDRKSTENFNRTKDVLADISTKAAVIQSTVEGTQQKLVDTITDIARPPAADAGSEFMRALLPQVLQNPEMLERLMEFGARQQQREQQDP